MGPDFSNGSRFFKWVSLSQMGPGFMREGLDFINVDLVLVYRITVMSMGFLFFSGSWFFGSRNPEPALVIEFVMDQSEVFKKFFFVFRIY